MQLARIPGTDPKVLPCHVDLQAFSEESLSMAERIATSDAAWGYEGDTGPAHWGALTPQYALCRLGVSQSPIDLTADTIAKPHDLAFHYADSPFEIVDTGHTIQVSCGPGNKLCAGERQYDLQQFHFHHRSEHTRDGVLSDMEVHFVHSDARGHLAVVGILLTAGPQNDFVHRLWKHLPTAPGQKKIVDGGTGNITDLLPTDRSYFSYSGSLTTPPCTENVSWFVFPSPVAVSGEQIARFTALYPNNARPTQPLHDRVVYFSQM